MIKAVVDAAAGRVPVIAGIGSMTTAGAIALAQYAEGIGADGFMIVPPFYDPLDFTALKAFSRSIIGTKFIGQLVGQTTVGAQPRCFRTVTGSA